MKQVTLLAVDLAKDVFQVAGFTKGLVEVFNRQIKRKDLAAFMAQHIACDVAMEACYSSHHWARCFSKMGWIKVGTNGAIKSVTEYYCLT